MDYATKMALRAIVSGLRHGRVIDDAQVGAIIAALNDAIDKAEADIQRGAVHQLEVLRDQIARDNQVSPQRD